MSDELLNQVLPKWIVNKVKSISDIEEVYFYFTKNPIHYDEKQKVPLSKVTGTIHSDYNNGSWLEMLGNLKRVKKFSSIQQIRLLVDSSIEKVTFSKFGQEYLIGCDNHRTCILKFYDDDEFINGVVKEYVFDEELFYNYELLESYGFDIDKNIDYPSPDSIYWTIKFSNHSVFLNDRKQIQDFIQFYKSIKTGRFSLFKYWWRVGSTSKTEREKLFRLEDLTGLKFELAKIKLLKIKTRK